MDLVSRFLFAIAIPAALAAQGLVPNGDFTQGAAGWNRIRFDDPAGSTGVAIADVSGAGPSSALFADFVSPAMRTHADWLSDPFLLPDGTWPVTFAVMWQKPAPVQVPDPGNNHVELHLLDPSGRIVFTGHIPVPRQANLLERRAFRGQIVAPAPGPYRALISMQHSEQAGIGYRVWIDDIVCGDSSWSLIGDGCPGTNGRVPMIHARGAPTIGMRSWSVDLTQAFGPSTAWLGLGASTSSWFGTPLPFDAGGGCLLRVGVLMGFASAVAPNGAGSYPIPLPFDPSLRGTRLFAQWLVLDPGSGSSFGVTVSPGIQFEIQ